jgi:GNAT superfamily N-acetyltransferase
MSRRRSTDRRCELYALYLSQEHTRQGVGRVLTARAVEWLVGAGYLAATLWVLRDNIRARAFYEALGWAVDGTERREHRGEVPLDEVRYRISIGGGHRRLEG